MTLFFFLNLQLIEQWATIAKEKKISDYDFIATVTELTASSIVNAYKRFSPAPIGQVPIHFTFHWRYSTNSKEVRSFKCKT
jgi:hypothetical protein